MTSVSVRAHARTHTHNKTHTPAWPLCCGFIGWSLAWAPGVPTQTTCLFSLCYHCVTTTCLLSARCRSKPCSASVQHAYTNDTISIALKQADCVVVIDVDVLIIAPAAWQPPKPTTTCPHSSQATCSLCLPSCLQVAFVRPWMTSACKLKVTNKEITKTLQYIHDCCTRIRLASASF